MSTFHDCAKAGEAITSTSSRKMAIRITDGNMVNGDNIFLKNNWLAVSFVPANNLLRFTPRIYPGEGVRQMMLLWSALEGVGLPLASLGVCGILSTLEIFLRLVHDP